MNLAKFSTENTVLLTIVLISALIIGSFSIIRMPQEQFSEVPFFWVNIVVPYPGASSEDIEKSVTIKIEQEMQGIKDLKQIQSVTSDGLSVVRVEFDDGISNFEFQSLFQDVRTRLSNVRLPDGTLQPTASDFSSNDFLPVIEVVISGNTSYENLDKVARDLENSFLSVRDVSSIDLVGARDKKIIVEANRQKLEAFSISILEILQSVQSRNLSVPGGLLETESREYLLRTVGSIDNISQFENVIVRRTDSLSGVIRIGDLARVYTEFDSSGEMSKFNGKDSIVLRVSKVPRGDSIGVIDGIKKAVDLYQIDNSENIEITLVNDSTIQIRDSIDVLLSNALQGLLLLTVVLFLFLGARNALMTALSIPVTFAITFVILEALGETLNSNTLFGMVLVLGLIVDHSIVLTENIYRLRANGLSLREAAIQGTSQVAWPIVASSLTTVAAFLPLMLLPGTIGKFLRVIPLVVTISLLVSTAEAIIFIPAHTVEWPGGKKLKVKADFFDKIKPGFKRLIEKLYKKRIIVIGIFFALAIGIFSTIPFINQDLFSAEDFSLFYIDIDMPPGTNKDETKKLINRFEEYLLPLKGNGEVSNIISSIGYRSGGSDNTRSGNVGQIVVDLEEVKDGRTRAIVEIMDEVKKVLDKIPGPERVLYRKAQSGPPVSLPVGFRIRGDNYAGLIDTASKIKEKLASYPDLINIQDNLQSGTPELRIIVNEERAAFYGLSVSSIGGFIRGSYDGYSSGNVFINNEELSIVVKYNRDSDVSSIQSLLELKIPTPKGALIPFSAIAEIKEGAALASIKRIDGKREVSVSSGAVKTDNVRLINQEIKDWFTKEVSINYPDQELIVGGEFADLDDLLIQILRVFLLGVFLIYAVLGAQFKSFTQPFIILISIPMAFAGVVLFLVTSGTPFSTTVLYAGVALAGIAVNDSIVFIDFVNQLRKEGKSIQDSVIEAASTRLRPIILTSVTTIGGLLPTAIGLGGFSVVWSPMASTIIFGLLFSTVTVISVLPCLYGLLFDRRRKNEG
jgi:multidrug efflux pump subunit AcrB